MGIKEKQAKQKAQAKLQAFIQQEQPEVNNQLLKDHIKNFIIEKGKEAANLNFNILEAKKLLDNMDAKENEKA